MSEFIKYATTDIPEDMAGNNRHKYDKIWADLLALPVGKCLRLELNGISAQAMKGRIYQGLVYKARAHKSKVSIHYRQTPDAAYVWLTLREESNAAAHSS